MVPKRQDHFGNSEILRSHAAIAYNLLLDASQELEAIEQLLSIEDEQRELVAQFRVEVKSLTQVLYLKSIEPSEDDQFHGETETDLVVSQEVDLSRVRQTPQTRPK